MLIPMMSCFIWGCSQHRAGNRIVIDDDKISREDAQIVYLSASLADTTIVTSPSGTVDTEYRAADPIPLKVNGKGILTRESLDLTPQCQNPGAVFSLNHILKKAQLEKTLAKLGTGSYGFSISNIVIDAAGRVAAYTMQSIQRYGKVEAGIWTPGLPIGEKLTAGDQEQIKMKIAEQLIGSDVRFTIVNDAKGQASPYFLDRQQSPAMTTYELQAGFTVADNSVTISSTIPEPVRDRRNRVSEAYRIGCQ